MASSGKKGKKNKGTVISLQSFLNIGDTPAGTTQVAKKVRNLDGDDSDDGGHAVPMVLNLPTAPRSSRIFDDDSIPYKPPFTAYLMNLPYDADEDDIYAFFSSQVQCKSLRLPREEGETGRVRGFGYAEFDTRDDLITVLSWADPSIKGRRIRIELFNENDHQQNRQQRGNNRRGFDNFGNSGENRESTNWRRDNQEGGSGGGGGGGGGYRNYDRNDRNDRNDRDRGGYRRNNDEGGNDGGSWRTGNRNMDASPRRDRYDGNSRNRNYDRDDRDRSRDDEPAQERPKLNLKPRTLPLPEIVAQPEPEEKVEEVKPPPKVGVKPEQVFGSAKPVDTAARELEIEERLAETRRQERLQRENQQKENDQLKEKMEDMHIDKTDKENANSVISWRQKTDDERKGGSPDRRNDNRRRDNKDYNSFNRNRDRNDRNDRSDGTRDRNTRDNNRDVRRTRDDGLKQKRDVKVERPLPKYQPNQPEPILQSTNKYSGLDDDDSE